MDEELVPGLDKVGVAGGAACAADEEVSTIDDGLWQGGKPDGPNIIVFYSANFIFFIFGGISNYHTRNYNIFFLHSGNHTALISPKKRTTSKETTNTAIPKCPLFGGI